MITFASNFLGSFEELIFFYFYSLLQLYGAFLQELGLVHQGQTLFDGFSYMQYITFQVCYNISCHMLLELPPWSLQYQALSVLHLQLYMFNMP